MIEHDPLERELKALQPQPVSLELQVRIEDRLQGDYASARRNLKIYVLGLVASMVVFSVGMVILFGHRQRPDSQQYVIDGPGVRHETVEGRDSLPTLAAYRQAFARSPEALEALLDKHAAAALAAQDRGEPVRAFPQLTPNRFD